MWQVIKNSDCLKNFRIKLDDFRNNAKKNKLTGHFWMYFLDIVLIVYMFGIKI